MCETKSMPTETWPQVELLKAPRSSTALLASDAGQDLGSRLKCLSFKVYRSQESLEWGWKCVHDMVYYNSVWSKSCTA